MLLEVELNENEIHKDDTDGLFRDSLIQLPLDYNKFEDERKTQEMNLQQKKKNHEYKELCNLRTRRSRQKSRVPWKSRRAGEGGKRCCFIHPAG